MARYRDIDMSARLLPVSLEAQAQAHGTGLEQELLLPVVDACCDQRTAHTRLTADAGYHSEANLAALAERGIDRVRQKAYAKSIHVSAGEVTHRSDRPAEKLTNFPAPTTAAVDQPRWAILNERGLRVRFLPWSRSEASIPQGQI